MIRPTASVSSTELKACCAASYGSDIVALLLGSSYHPGGMALTRHVAALLGLRHGEELLDVAAGRGSSALALASEYGTTVTGVDLSEANVAAAAEAAAAAGLTDTVRFRLGDAECLPVDSASVDAVLCECAFCTFPDKPTAAAEVVRVLRPGGRLGITDVTVDRDRLPAELSGLGGWIACVADARPLEEYAKILAGAGLRVTGTERHDSAIAAMVDQIEARLTLARMTSRERAESAGVDFARAPVVLAAVRRAVAEQVIGYAVLVAHKPT